MNSIALVCGSFHKKEVEEMISHAESEAAECGLEITDVVWVPGSMEAPLATARLLENEGIAGVACLGIIEKGQTSHGLAMGQAVVKTILELQLVHNKPIGLGIIGPGAKPEHIGPRLGPHATAAVDALMPFL